MTIKAATTTATLALSHRLLRRACVRRKILGPNVRKLAGRRLCFRRRELQFECRHRADAGRVVLIDSGHNPGRGAQADGGRQEAQPRLPVRLLNRYRATS